jgi:hypothetical protein
VHQDVVVLAVLRHGSALNHGGPGIRLTERETGWAYTLLSRSFFRAGVEARVVFVAQAHVHVYCAALPNFLAFLLQTTFTASCRTMDGGVYWQTCIENCCRHLWRHIRRLLKYDDTLALIDPNHVDKKHPSLLLQGLLHRADVAASVRGIRHLRGTCVFYVRPYDLLRSSLCDAPPVRLPQKYVAVTKQLPTGSKSTADPTVQG